MRAAAARRQRSSELLERATQDAVQCSRAGFQFTAGLLWTIFLASCLAWSPIATGTRTSTVIGGLLHSAHSPLAVLWPQGWTFFAAEPTTPLYVAFRFSGDGQVVEVSQARGGLRMDMSDDRLAGVLEAEDLGAVVPQAAWLHCGTAGSSECEAEVLRRTATLVVNDTTAPSLCGHLLIALMSPTALAGFSTMQIANVIAQCR